MRSFACLFGLHRKVKNENFIQKRRFRGVVKIACKMFFFMAVTSMEFSKKKVMQSCRGAFAVHEYGRKNFKILLYVNTYAKNCQLVFGQ